MPMDAVSNAPQSVGVSQLTIYSGKTEVILDKLGAIKHDYQVQEFVVQGAAQDNQVNCVQMLVGWFEFLKKAIGIHEKKHDSYTAQAKSIKPRRRGMYTFLYGGRVNLNTFYDYKDQSQ